MIIDLRSDTFTKPSPEMLEAMFSAKVGDDVFGEDPTMNELENMTAEMFGMEAAVFCPSGTMTNQIAIKVHTQPGDEVICEKLSHVYIYEGGGIAFNSGCQVKTIEGNHGQITADQVQLAINPTDIHKAATSLVSLENTTNRGGGNCYELADIQAIKMVCLQNNLKLHLDGARLFNALVAKQQTPIHYGELFDSISICLSKGLGTPVGSLLLGNSTYIKKARRVRKVFGGGMRQAGYLAAAGIYALDNHVERLAEDHRRAREIAQVLQSLPWIAQIEPVETNILIFSIQPYLNEKIITEKLKEKGISISSMGHGKLRIVTHLDYREVMHSYVLETLLRLKM